MKVASVADVKAPVPISKKARKACDRYQQRWNGKPKRMEVKQGS
jgi:hypothetical protein